MGSGDDGQKRWLSWLIVAGFLLWATVDWWRE